MIISSFAKKDLTKAQSLVKENYEEERETNPSLPTIKTLPDIGEIAQKGVGVVLYEGDKMLGFLCAKVEERFEALRAFCPIHGHGALKENRAMIYSRLYEAAAQKLVEKKVLTHEITLFSHDEQALDSFFYNVFGACVIYAAMDIKDMVFKTEAIAGIKMCELDEKRYGQIRELQNGLISHLRKSPVFLPYIEETAQSFERIKNKRYFVALKEDKLIAYIRAQQNAGNFVASDADTINISGAYMYPEFRGSGIYSKLLWFLSATMKEEGYKRISVDFETYNPNAMRFWTKNFTPYTTTLTRKIEPRILETADF